MSSEPAREAVVFIHSTGTMPSLWSSVPEAVAKGRRRVFPANLGYPPNPPVTHGVHAGVDDDAEHVLGAIPEDAARVHLVAHSYGGLIALRLIAPLGGRLASLFLYEPVLFGALHQLTEARDDPRSAAIDPEARSQARFFLDHPWFIGDEERAGRAEWLEVFIDYWNKPGSWAKMPQALREASLALGWKMSREVRSCALDNASFDDWNLRVPITLMRGERSPAASRAMTKLLADAAKKTSDQVTLVEGVGLNHMAPLVAPGPVHEALGQHFERVFTGASE